MGGYIHNMTGEQFMEKVIQLYVEARKPSFYHPKIRRGRSHSIPSKVEDLFAAYLAYNLVEDVDIYVDQGVTSQGLKTLYPDIVILQSGVIKQIFDIKMDLGWKRDSFVEFCEKNDEQIVQFRGVVGRIKDGVSKEITEVKYADDLKYRIVIINSGNINRNQFEENISQASHLENVDVYVLSENKHPNEYGISSNELLAEMKIRGDEFERILVDASKTL